MSSIIQTIDGWDIGESLAEGGAVSVIVYAIAGGVATLPASFITPVGANVLTVISGALTFGAMLFRIRRAKSASAPATTSVPAAAPTGGSS